MKKEWRPGIPIESGCDYFAREKEYHITLRDTVTVQNERYIALRTDAFPVFLLLCGKKNVTLDFGGATLVFHGKIQPFLLDGGENITVKNCKVTYARPMYSEFLIREMTEEGALLAPNPCCPCRVEGDLLIPVGEGWENNRLRFHGRFFQVFDPETRLGCGLHLGGVGTPFVPDPTFPYRIDLYTAEARGENILLKGKFPDFYRAGRILVIEHEERLLSSVFALEVKGLTLENYRILSGGGMGILLSRVEDVTLSRFLMTHTEESPALIANPADGVHAFGASGAFRIRDSIFEGMIDDALNVHANFRTVKQAQGREILSHRASCEKQAQRLYRAGDEIAVYRGQTMEEVARYRILSVEFLDGDLAKFTVDRPVLPHEEGDMIESLTANCDLTIENCAFGKANTHLRLQTRGTCAIRNCTTELPFLFSGDATYWFESGPATDFTVENCRFVGEKAKICVKSEVLSTDAAPYYHRNLKILGCTFDTESPLEAQFADGIRFLGNRNAQGKEMTLTLKNCGEAEADNCRVLRLAEKQSLNIN